MRLKIYVSVLILVITFSSFNQAFAQVPQNTTHDILLLMQEKQSRTPVQRKIESQLLQALRESRGQKMVDSVNLEPANINADNTGYFKADITATVSDDLITRIEGLGGTIIYPSWQYHTIRALINFSMIETIAGYADVKFIEPAVGSITVGNPVRDGFKISTGKTFNNTTALQNNNSPAKRLTLEERTARIRSLLEKYLNNKMAAQVPFTGTVNSQGDHAHRADDVRNTYGYTGQGIRIGILSDSYNALNGAAADVANGNLPGPGNPLSNTTAVTVVQDITGASDEGRAMLQIVHDLAPQAQLFFATADVSEAGFATNIQALRNAPYNCDIIIDDVFYFDEPVFQDGVVAQAVNTVTAAGALYFSSAGNEGNLAKNTSGYFEGDFDSTGSPAFAFPGGTKTGTIHNFGTVAVPVNGDIITSTGSRYTLNWSDASGASANDYDLFIVSSLGAIKAQSTNIQSGTQNPYESISPSSTCCRRPLSCFQNDRRCGKSFCN